MPHRVFGYALLGVILGSPLLLTGGNEALFTVLLGLTLLLSFLFLLKQPIDGALKVPLRLFLAFIGCQLLTLIPIPVAWIRWLSPGLHKVLLNFPEVAYHTLSWDAILTMKTLAIYVAAAAVFLVAYHLWEDPLEKVPFVVQLFFWTGTFWVVVSLFLHYTTPGRVPFLPWQPEPWFFGLFTNENIFGAYCAMLIPIGITWSVHRAKTWREAPGMAPLVALAVLLLIGALIASQSVGAIVAVFLAAVIYWLPVKKISVPALIASAGAAILLWAPKISGEAYRSFIDRLDFAGLALNSLASLPLFGGGLGTTALLAGHYQAPQGNHIVDKIHNDWLELLLCSGFSGLLFLTVLGMIGLALFRLYDRQFLVRAGLAGALLTLGLHSLVDFPIQNFAVLTFAAFMMGFSVRMILPDRSKEMNTIWVLVLLLLAASLGVLSLSAQGLVRVRGGQVSAWQTARSMSLLRNNRSAVEPLLAVHGLMAPLWGELALVQEKEGQFSQALESMQKAIALQPTNPKLHRAAARLSFVAEGGERFINHLVAAFALEPLDVDKLFPLSQAHIERIVLAGTHQAYRYYGPGAAGHYHLGHYILKRNGSFERRKLIEEAARLFPDNNPILFAAGEECLVSGDLIPARNYAERAVALGNSSYDATLLARILAASGDRSGSLANLRKALDYANSGEEISMVVSWAPECLKGSSPQVVVEIAEAGFNKIPNAATAVMLGRMFCQHRGLEEAVRWYERSIQLDPAAEYAYRELLPLLIAMGDRHRLKAYRAKAMSLFPQASWIPSEAYP